MIVKPLKAVVEYKHLKLQVFLAFTLNRILLHVNFVISLEKLSNLDCTVH
jgi:hypothetical protein